MSNQQLIKNDPLLLQTSTLETPTTNTSTISPLKTTPVYFVRHHLGLDVFSGDIVDDPSPILNIQDNVLNAVWSPDGQQLAIHTANNNVLIYKHPTWELSEEEPILTPIVIELSRFPNSSPIINCNLRHIQWSPKGTYIVCFWQYDIKAIQGGFDDRNIFVWNTSLCNNTSISYTPLSGFTLKGLTVGQWPVLKWRQDEIYCCLTSRSEVIIYPGEDPGGDILLHLPLTGVVQIEPAPILDNINHNEFIFSAFSPAIQGGKHSTFYIVTIPDLYLKKPEWFITVEQSLGVADSAEMYWSPKGKSVLILACTTVDSAGENYGGVGDAYLSRSDGSLTYKINQKVAQEVSWNPSQEEFILIEGKSPSDISLHDDRGRLQFAFPKAYRNTIRWDHFGLMVAIGGFGNLAGDLSFWYNDPITHQMQFITEWRESCTVLCQWNFNGFYFSTASTFPRMKVDNQFKIFNYEGQMLLKKTYFQLFDFQWKPEIPGIIYSQPPPPTSQMALLDKQGIKKFRSTRDIAAAAAAAASSSSSISEGGDHRRRLSSTVVSTKRKETHSVFITKNPVTSATAAQAAKIERQRHIHSIADWRTGESHSNINDKQYKDSEQPLVKQSHLYNSTTLLKDIVTNQSVKHTEAQEPSTNMIESSYPSSTSLEDRQQFELIKRNHPHLLIQTPFKSSSSCPPIDNAHTLPLTDPHDPLSSLSPASTPLPKSEILNNIKETSFVQQPGLLSLLKSILPPDAQVHMNKQLAENYVSHRSSPIISNINKSFQHSDRIMDSNTTSLIPSDINLTSQTHLLPLSLTPMTSTTPPLSHYPLLHHPIIDPIRSKTNHLSFPPTVPLLQSDSNRLLNTQMPLNNDLGTILKSFESIHTTQETPLSQIYPTETYYPDTVSKKQLSSLHINDKHQQNSLHLTQDVKLLDTNFDASFIQPQHLSSPFLHHQEFNFTGLNLAAHQNHFPSIIQHEKHSNSFSSPIHLNKHQETYHDPNTLSQYNNNNNNNTQCPPPPSTILEKRPNPMIDTCWEYIDPMGHIRGPFHVMEMRHWFISGYFTGSLPVRYYSKDPFKPLHQIYFSASPFTTFPDSHSF